jgi:hypothetical protein
MWNIKRIIDKGPGHYYRFHVSGKNYAHNVPEDFHWNVRDLNDARYHLDADADAVTRAIFLATR